MFLLVTSVLASQPAPELFQRMAELPDPYLPVRSAAPPPPEAGSRLLDVYRAGDLALLVDADGEWLAEATSQILAGGGDFSWVLDSMSGAFYRDFGDDYQYLTVLMVSDFGLFFAFYSPIANDVRGIGYANFARVDVFDTQPDNQLDGFIFMNYYGGWYENRASGRYVFGQEFMHRWGSFVEMDHAELASDALLGRDAAHWSYWFDTPNSPMEGNSWRDLGTGEFEVAYQKTSTYSPLDLYLMGFVPPEEVPPMTFLSVSAEEQDRVGREPASTPEYLTEVTSEAGRGIQVAATPVTVTVDDIIAHEGARDPAADQSPRTFKMAFLVLVLADDVVDDTVLAEIDSVRQNFEADWEADVLDLADLDTTLGDGTAAEWGVDTSATDSGTADSGVADTAEEVSVNPEVKGGCGCGSPIAPGAGLAAVVALGLMVGRRRGPFTP